MKVVTKKISEASVGSTSTYTDFEPLLGHNISFLLYIWCVASTQETVRVLSGEFHAQTGAFIVSISCGFYPSNRLLPVEYIKYKERHSLAIMMANIGRSTGTLAPSVPQHMMVHLYLLYRVDIQYQVKVSAHSGLVSVCQSHLSHRVKVHMPLRLLELHVNQYVIQTMTLSG
eukprot:4763_1